MNLSIKDLYTTILAISLGSISYLTAIGIKIPIINGNYRLGSVLLLIGGLAMCALGSNSTTMNSRWTMPLAAVAIITTISIVIGIITGSRLVYIAASAAILILWFFATLRHATGA